MGCWFKMRSVPLQASKYQKQLGLASRGPQSILDVPNSIQTAQANCKFDAVE